MKLINTGLRFLSIFLFMSLSRPVFGGMASDDDMVFIKGGCYQMGDVFGNGKPDEKPAHEVCIDDFYIGRHEVTQRQWMEIMGTNPSFFMGCDDCPVENISWNKVQEYINKLNKKSPLTKGGRGLYRLPTEAEWEYAARSGGKKERWAGTNDNLELDKYVWYNQNSGGIPHPVGQKNPNGLGLYDMTGNAWEWCSDWYDENYYKNSPRDNPNGPAAGVYRVLRGGSWIYSTFEPELRIQYRNWLAPDYRIVNGGFRLAASVR